MSGKTFIDFPTNFNKPKATINTFRYKIIYERSE